MKATRTNPRATRRNSVNLCSTQPGLNCPGNVINTKRRIKQMQLMIDQQAELLAALECSFTYSSSFPCEHPEITYNKAVLQGMQLIYKTLLSK